MIPSATPPTPGLKLNSSWWNRRCFYATFLVAAVVLVYWNSLNAPFIFDDLGAVQNNPSIRQLWPVTNALHPPADGSTTTGRPILNLTFAVNYTLSADSPWSYHWGNLLIHAAATLTLFGLARRSLLSPVLENRFAVIAQPLAFSCALLWAVHPLLTESVTCIAQRSESLFGLLYLATLYGFVRSVISPHRLHWSAFAVITCWLGMGSKEAMVSAPLLVLLYDRTFIAGTFAAAWRQRRSFYGALASSWLLLSALLLAGAGTRGLSAGAGLSMSWWSYALKQSEAIVLYLTLSVWPHPLVLDYGSAVIESITAVWWQLLLVLALVSSSAWALWRRPVAGFIAAWFFAILAPSSSVIPLVTQTIAEHRMYLPLAGLICGLVPLLARRWSPWIWIPVGATAIAFGTLTLSRNQDYRNALLIWQDTAEKYPSNGRAFINWGIELGKIGRDDEALAQFHHAIELNAESLVSGHYHSGITDLKIGRLSDALHHLEAAVQLAPKHADAQFAFANALVQANQPSAALAHYAATLQIKPAADAHANCGVALALLHRTPEAIEQFQLALQLAPNLVEARYQLAQSFQQSGRAHEANDQFAEALRLAPNRADVQGDYGIALAQAGRLPEAVEHLTRAVQLKPDDAEAHTNLGNAWLMQSKVAPAIAEYEIALRLKPGEKRTEENLHLAREALRAHR